MIEFEKLRFRRDVLFKDMGDEGVLLNPSNSSYYRLNELALRVFRVLAEEKPTETQKKLDLLTSDLSKEYALPPEQIQTDISAFIQNLVTQQLFE